MLDKIEELKRKKEELELELQHEYEQFFKDTAKGIFERYPNLESFSWKQFTPYFNDGDTCYFSVRSDDIYLSPIAVDEDKEVTRFFLERDGRVPNLENYKDWWMDGSHYGLFGSWNGKFVDGSIEIDAESYLRGYPRWAFGAGADCSELIRVIDSDIMEDLFGDHALVRVNREGIFVDIYDDHY